MPRGAGIPMPVGQDRIGALDSRIVIEQAKGVLAGRHGIDVSAGFERLRDHSRDDHARSHEVCRQVIAGELDV